MIISADNTGPYIEKFLIGIKIGTHFFKNRYPELVIGFSSHEYHSWDASMFIAYGKGARTFERHIDIDYKGVPVSKYCSLPDQADQWFKAFRKAEEMCGGAGSQKRVVSTKEQEYLEDLVRGVYAKNDLEAGHLLTQDDVFLAIPLQKGQISCREFRTGEVLKQPVKSGQKILIGDVETGYSNDGEFVKYINQRGV